MNDYPIVPTPFTSVTLTDRFWRPRLETSRTVTLPDVLRKCENTGRVDNFLRAARRRGPYVGKMPFDDTDVYKAIEGASYTLAQRPDADLDAYLDHLVAAIAGAQEPDGYLYTSRTIDPGNAPPWAGPERWSNLAMSHELYNCGHLYDAAAAHHLATGKRSLLEVALGTARLIREVFGPRGRHDVPGHPIVEMGLARLYRITGDTGCLEAARFFLDERGRHGRRRSYGAYSQDHLPVLDQYEAVGHAVRAVYLYCGMADAAALLDEPLYAAALHAIWRDVVGSKIYLTGGLGARHEEESFGAAFELPNATAYAETCAAIGSVMWNHRMYLSSGVSAYYDVLEQTLYNGLLSGVSLRGDRFFYPNPLESDGVFAFNFGAATRQPWFECSCCPTSLCRFLPSLPGYLYATDADGLSVNLFAASRARVQIAGVGVDVTQETGYPWEGSIRLTVEPERPLRMRLRVRIPGWVNGQILGGSLYRFERPGGEEVRLAVNGAEVPVSRQKGYAVLERLWSRGDTVELSLPMPVRKVLCDPRVADNRGKAALQRGPVVYCVEGRDADRPLGDIMLGPECGLTAGFEPDLLSGVVTVRGRGFVAIPYYAWANRGPGPMRVWMRNGV